MNLFTLRRREPEAAEPAAPEWHPVSGEVITVPGSEMDDDGCAGTHAYGADYQLADGSAPTAMLTCWTYPVYGNPDERGYVLGRRFEYIVYMDGAPPWTWADWQAAGEDQSVYPDLDAARRAARNAAGTLAVSAFGSAAGGGGLAGFDWDGQPW